MISNISKLEKDLDALIKKGTLLHYAMVNDSFGKEFVKNLSETKTPDEVEKIMKDLPSFIFEYDPWYSEALAVIKQLIPDRLANFISFYEKPKNRKSILSSNYVIQDYLQGISVSRGGEKVADKSDAIAQFRQQLSILSSAKKRFKSSLFEIRQILQADLFDTELDSARELLKNKFLRAAGAISGVVLEKHLQQVCYDHNISINSKNHTITVLNDALKASSIIDQSQWRFISLMGDYRNMCDHNDKKKGDPTEDQVKDLIDGTEKIMKTIN